MIISLVRFSLPLFSPLLKYLCVSGCQKTYWCELVQKLKCCLIAEIKVSDITIATLLGT